MRRKINEKEEHEEEKRWRAVAYHVRRPDYLLLAFFILMYTCPSRIRKQYQEVAAH